MVEHRCDPVDVGACRDPVAAVLAAHHEGRRLLLRTSGTSSSARVVVRSTDSWFDSFELVTALFDLDAGGRVWLPGPLSATMNLFAAVHAASVGASLVRASTEATHVHLTAAMLRRILAQEPTTLAGLRVVVAGEALPAGLHDQAERHAAAVGHYYGAAELSLVAAGPHSDELRAVPGVQVAERSGQLWVRSPYVCDGYLGEDGCVRDAPPLRRDAAGWTTVGDRGAYVGERVVVTGRGGDAVTTAGATVPLAEVEPVLRAVAGGQLWVVGLPHAYLGQVLTAVLSDPADHEVARAHARRVLPATHRPRRWYHLDGPVPTTEAGKVDPLALTRLVSAGTHVRRLA
ncbi:AMP-binding protein [Haloechinothrix alba]|uniref:AMP-binding protein n=1 Tax=Haloechinothrix alba TaxID=664784 RepID=UPI001595B73F|nr:AMP-binding protein [Haloechinothrix alba]